MKVVIVGAGIFGASAAIALRRRGHEVTVADAGPLPHPDAASTDINKMIRLDYGADDFYLELMEAALPRWREIEGFHEPGVAFLSRRPLEAHGFEAASMRALAARGHDVERLDESAIARRFPAWRGLVDGYYNPQGGWAESGAVLGRFIEEARRLGVRWAVGRAVSIDGSTVVTEAGSCEGERVVVAAGAWSPALLPELEGRLVSVAQPVIGFAPRAVDAFRPPQFVTWAADIATSGWYGFPANSEGIVKVGHHGRGIAGAPGTVTFPETHEATCRAFLRSCLPSLADAPIVVRRLCHYCDTSDGDFLIDRVPARPEVVVASGGSGHAFKLAPLLGDMIADVVEGRPGPARFRWRAGADRREAARSSV